jgi:hypothetical protein
MAAGVASAVPSSGASPTSAAINTHTTKSAVIHVPRTGFTLLDYCSVNVDGTSSELTVKGLNGVHYLVHGNVHTATTADADVRVGPNTVTSGPVSVHATGSGFQLTAETIGGYGASTAASANGTLTVTTSSHTFTMTYAESATDSVCTLNTALRPSASN